MESPRATRLTDGDRWKGPEMDPNAHSERLTYRRQAEMLRAMAHPARLQLLTMLMDGPLCVYQLVEQTGYRQPYISQQLAVLRRAGLVVGRRAGMAVWYQLVCAEMGGFLAAVHRACLQQIAAAKAAQHTPRMF